MRFSSNSGTGYPRPLSLNTQPIIVVIHLLFSPITSGYLGLLQDFSVQHYENHKSALMFCQGDPHSFKTLILRGADLATLAVLKHVLRYSLHVLQVRFAAAAAANVMHPCHTKQCLRLEALYMNANKADLEFDTCNTYNTSPHPTMLLSPRRK